MWLYKLSSYLYWNLFTFETFFLQVLKSLIKCSNSQEMSWNKLIIQSMQVHKTYSENIQILPWGPVIYKKIIILKLTTTFYSGTPTLQTIVRCYLVNSFTCKLLVSHWLKKIYWICPKTGIFERQQNLKNFIKTFFINTWTSEK